VANPLDLLPGNLDIKTRAGNDVAFQISLPYDASAGVHQLLISTSPGGDSIKELTDGDGLTVTGTNPTLIDVLIPVAFMSQYPATNLCFDYNLTLGGVLKTKISGTIQTLRSIVKRD
jgi:hypothetical protein